MLMALEEKPGDHQFYRLYLLGTIVILYLFFVHISVQNIHLIVVEKFKSGSEW